MGTTKGKKKPMQFRLPEPLYDRMAAIADDLGCSMNAWAIRALAFAAKNHVPLDDYLNQPPTRGRGKQRTEYKRLSPFAGLPVDELGIPEGVNVSGGELELARRLKEGGEPGLQRFMETLWQAGKVGTDYTDAHLAETLRVLAASDD